jgi:hypothetical protein
VAGKGGKNRIGFITNFSHPEGPVDYRKLKTSASKLFSLLLPDSFLEEVCLRTNSNAARKAKRGVRILIFLRST